ncbi:ATP-binding protein [Rhodococcus sp. O3]|uniref:ATP-binding protein n=1 Tax=Rhodococcus sp. O3 TaxID=3404919 RepID=UPI003B66E746
MSDDSPPRQRWWNIEGWGLRWKVTAVLAIPVTVAMVLGGLRIQEELTNAVHFSQAADQVAHVPDLVDFGTALGTLAGTTAAGLSTPEEVARLDETLEQVRTVALNPELDPVVAADLTRVLAGAEALRDQMKAGQVPIADLNQRTTEVRSDMSDIVSAIVDPIEDEEVLLEGTRLVDAWSTQRYLFDQVMGIVSILRDPDQPGTQLISASGAELAMLETLARSYPLADGQIEELRTAVKTRSDMVDAAGDGPLPLLNLRTSMMRSLEIYGSLIQQATEGITTTVEERAAETRSAALRDTAIVLATLLAALVLALLVSRSLVGPIRRLRYGALKVARQELPEAVDRIKLGDNIEDIEFTRVPVHTTEEIGQLARAVDDMHGQALRLAGEQAHLRLQINEMFETLARRSKSLVEQQLGLIERLEFEEKDPSRLESLFRLDHLAARMRRNGDNLLILSGTRVRRGHSAPVQLGDILRAAMSEVEDYQRVQIGSTPDGALSGAVATDIVHLLAELVDNSLRASPPDSNVTFSFARAVDGGLLVEIADRGIGIPAEELEAINHRLSQGGEVGPDSARHMGLFVVSRLADRHGLTVRLRPTFDTARNPGITASVHIPDVLLVSPLALSHTGPQPWRGTDMPNDVQEQPALPRAEREMAQLPAATQQDRPAHRSGEIPEVPRQARPEVSGELPVTPVQPQPQSLQKPEQNGHQQPERNGHHRAPNGRPVDGLPQREPGATPGLPRRQPGATPGLPVPQSSATPPAASTPTPRVQPDAAAALASALPSRQRPAAESDSERTVVTPSVDSGPVQRPQDAGVAQRPQEGGLPQRQPGATPGLPQRSAPQPSTTQQPAPQHAGSQSPAPQRQSPPPGLPQRQPGATPGLTPAPASSGVSAPAPSEPVAPLAPIGGPVTGLPQRQPGTTPGLPQRHAQQPVRRPDPVAEAPVETATPAPVAAPVNGLPQRQPGATPGLPQRQPGATPGLPQRSAQSDAPQPAATLGAADSSAPVQTAPSIANGDSVSPHSEASQAARHRYRTNSAKTASFFQPRGETGALRRQAAAPPIFDDVMSDWLVDPTSLPEDRRKREWTSPADAGWEAAQRAAEVPVEDHTTAGLPRRAPGHRLVPGAVEPAAPVERPTIRRRDPEAIRANLSRHQQGVRNGRSTVNATTRENNEQGVR